MASISRRAHPSRPAPRRGAPSGSGARPPWGVADNHLALVRLARQRARHVPRSSSILRFAPHEDFASYPRALDQDVAALAKAGVDTIWAPSVGLMYGPGFATRIVPDGPAKVGLEDAFRPHFFGGVATVVSKLLIQCTPDLAIFGEKDFQQLKVVTRLTADLDLPVKIVGAPIVRANDGLALSSRNANLSVEERAAAPTLFRVLSACARRIADDERIARVLDEGGAEIERAGFRLDYLEARNAETLAKVESMADGPPACLWRHASGEPG